MEKEWLLIMCQGAVDVALSTRDLRLAWQEGERNFMGFKRR
ncbi:hypothetical protein [Acidithiobacillus ferrivorans]|nr:hypothetical protein [Acidithiobacillus ferrivorans]